MIKVSETMYRTLAPRNPAKPKKPKNVKTTPCKRRGQRGK